MASQDSSPEPSPDDSDSLWLKLKPLFELTDHKRPWGMLITVALSVGSPVLLGTLLGQFEAGIGASCGGLASIYLRQTALHHRLITMALVTFGFCACYLLMLLAGFSYIAVAAAALCGGLLGDLYLPLFCDSSSRLFLFYSDRLYRQCHAL